jgi:hypothetical protein
MFRFFGGVPRLVVCNLKSGLHRASFYNPETNRSCGMMASHYGVDILPAAKLGDPLIPPGRRSGGNRPAMSTRLPTVC